MRAPRAPNPELDGMMMLADAMSRGSSDGLIEESEKRGQQSFVNSDTLPTEGDRKELEAAGVRFLGPVEGDPIFTYVELPEGWKKVATDHDMWSKLVDAEGVERASIFYKAAFYDRSAFLSVT